MSSIVALFMGLGINLNRIEELPVDQAKYLDDKILEFYK